MFDCFSFGELATLHSITPSPARPPRGGGCGRARSGGDGVRMAPAVEGEDGIILKKIFNYQDLISLIFVTVLLVEIIDNVIRV